MDLMDNDIINEPEILHYLVERYLKKKIYTYVENTLLTINPYLLIPELYTDTLRSYYITAIIENDGAMKDH
jgi:myosin heavy subunit